MAIRAPDGADKSIKLALSPLYTIAPNFSVTPGNPKSNFSFTCLCNQLCSKKIRNHVHVFVFSFYDSNFLRNQSPLPVS